MFAHYDHLRARNYSDVKRALVKCQPFTHATCSGTWETARETLYDAGGVVYEVGESVYVVRSYRTPVAWVTISRTTVTDQRYSVTTSKQCGIFGCYLPGEGVGTANAFGDVA